MKILVLSDSHGEQRYMEQAVFAETPDRIIHLGDRFQDGEKLQKKFCRIPFDAVPGNCDLFSVEPAVKTLRLGGIDILATHGHTHGVKGSLLRLYYAAQQAGVKVAVYGHTHVANHEVVDGIHILNPGAAGGGRPSYGVIEISVDGTVSCRITYL